VVETFLNLFLFIFSADPEGPGFCALILTLLAGLLLVVTMPFSLFTCIKVCMFMDFRRLVFCEMA
jgi:hypothetical protein